MMQHLNYFSLLQYRDSSTVNKRVTYLDVFICMIIRIHSVPVEGKVILINMYMYDIYLLSFDSGTLCSECVEGYGLTFDLLRCRDNCSSFGGIILYIVVCQFIYSSTFHSFIHPSIHPSNNPSIHLSLTKPSIHPFIHSFGYLTLDISLIQRSIYIYSSGILTVVVSLVILYFDIPIPNELKSIIFFGQVRFYKKAYE